MPVETTVERPPRPAPRPAERSCLVLREAGDRERLVRFARTPDGAVTPDLAGKLPGRGAWVTARRDAVATAARKGLFARGFQAPTRLPAGQDPDAFAEAVADGLRRRILEGVGLARRAGAISPGFEPARAALKGGEAGLLIGAADAAEDGAGKLARLAFALGVPAARVFSTAALSRAAGLDGVRHMAVARGGIAARLLADLRRLDGFEPVMDEAPQTEGLA